jgi:hypothetical protein
VLTLEEASPGGDKGDPERQRGAASDEGGEVMVDDSEVADVGLSGFMEQRCGDAEHGEVDQPGEAQADDAIPFVEPE